jgi:enoyl-CoA hydratase/carnithine racemase
VTQQFGDVSVEIGDDFVALVEIHRPPSNFFDVKLIRSLAEAYTTLDADPACRAIVLASEGKHFCAGADFSGQSQAEALPREGANSLYREAVRLFHAEKPVVAVVQGAAVGGGLGLACSADFRVAAPEARFSANFAQLGFHHGFGLTVTLPLITGHQHALELLYLGRRISGDEASRIGLCDRLVPLPEVRDRGRELAAEIATSGPLAVRSIRQTMRGHLADAIAAATDREDAEQVRLRTTSDFAEGTRAMAERRPPRFTGE